MDAWNIWKKTDQELEFQVESFRICLGSTEDSWRFFLTW